MKTRDKRHVSADCKDEWHAACKAERDRVTRTGHQDCCRQDQVRCTCSCHR